MAEVQITLEGHAGVIRLTRPKALNALSHAMCRAIDDALIAWRSDPAVRLVLIEAEGERAFCAGGDIAAMHAQGLRGDYAPGRSFWREEYRMNARLFEYPKPIISLMQGFVMGGGVGLGCHVGHRIVCESTQMSMPECGIGLIPDVGGTFLLALAPGRLGEYLGTTGARMGPADALLAGFADHFVPQADWPELRATMIAEGETTAIKTAKAEPPAGRLAAAQAEIDAAFALPGLAAISAALSASGTDFAQEALKALRRASPLSVAATLAMVRGLRQAPTLRAALVQEYRFTHRAMEGADFLEGVRAQIIDKDRTPRWRHEAGSDVPRAEVEAMLAPLGNQDLTFEE